VAVCQKLLAAGFLVLVPSTAFAYRPFDSTDADVAPPGKCEIDFQPVGLLAQGPARWLIAPELTLNFGLPAAFHSEFVVEGNGLEPESVAAGSHGYQVQEADLAVKTIWKEGTLQEKSGWSVATESFVLLPGTTGKGQTDATQNGFGLAVDAIASRRWRPAAIHLNFQPGLSRAHHLAWFAGAIAEGPQEWLVTPAMELTADTEVQGATEGGVLAGALLRLSRDLVFDAGLRGGQLREAGRSVDTLECRMGVSWTL
jgi:hypothetical protein